MDTLIKTEQEYNAILEKINSLMDMDPDSDSQNGKKLNYLVLLIKEYEKDLKINEIPDPLEAIKFRMEQQNLTQRDLIPYIGSRSKVSEILSGKRPLTIDMIKALNEGLKIPLKVLINENKKLTNRKINWNRFPIKEIQRRKWLCNIGNSSEENPKKIIKSLENQTGLQPNFAGMFRSNQNYRSGRKMDEYSLYSWKLRILQKANEESFKMKYDPSFLQKITSITEIVHLSKFDDGPLMVIDFLKRNGIIVEIEPHFKKTYLDGAVFFDNKYNPVIGLTLRYDRIDNFWFTLMHEIGHIKLHYNENITSFFDDLDLIEDIDSKEEEADEFARNSLIPLDAWENSPASKLKSPQAAQHLAENLNIHPAIVAGRMRYEFNTYRLLNKLIGNKEVRKLFNKIDWS